MDKSRFEQHAAICACPLIASHIPILSASVFFDGDNLKVGNLLAL
jgi:hypothetical protein